MQSLFKTKHQAFRDKGWMRLFGNLNRHLGAKSAFLDYKEFYFKFLSWSVWFFCFFWENDFHVLLRLLSSLLRFLSFPFFDRFTVWPSSATNFQRVVSPFWLPFWLTVCSFRNFRKSFWTELGQVELACHELVVITFIWLKKWYALKNLYLNHLLKNETIGFQKSWPKQTLMWKA